jgi:hypothetical protein
MSIKDDIIEIRKEVKDMEKDKFAMEILKDYKRSNKMKDVIIIILIGIITLFISGLVYVFINYDFNFVDTSIDGDNNNYNENIGGNVINGD